MSERLGISVEELISTATERGARIPAEIGAFVALETCEALVDAPARVRAADVRIADDGTVGVLASAGATSEQAARAVAVLLADLLGASGTGAPRSLAALLERGPSSGRWDLDSLRDDLEASLVPLNRAAARRVLSRMLRDVRRPRIEPAPPPPAAHDEGTLDAQLDALLDAEPAPDPAAALDAELDATISELDALPAPVAPEPPAAAAPEPRIEAPLPRAVAPAPDPEEATLQDAPPPRAAYPLESLADLEPPKRRGGSLGWMLAFLALVTATAAALAVMRPDLVDRALGRPPAPAPEPGPTEADRERMLREHRGRFGTLVVTASPPRAQVLMFVGRGPALARELPVGVALEFVAIADGRAPTRALVPADATWEEVDGRPRYELAMQTGSEPMEELALGETTLPRDVGTPSGALGDVRVITNPPGAKVYVVVGFAPDVTVENVRTDEAIELLVYAEGKPIRRLLVGPSDWVEASDGSKRAEVSVAVDAPE